MDHNNHFIQTHDLSSYISVHPHDDGEAADQLMELGLNRLTAPQAMMGYQPMPMVEKKIRPLKFWHKDYITIHLGVGENHVGLVERSTKSWDMTYAAQFVSLVKKNHPNLGVVQLGSTLTSQKIPGVDTCFLGLNIDQSFQVLAGSRMHIDGDSGLVHAATTFGVKCIVLFGPTPAKYFGHQQNMNMNLDLPCSGCWWSTDTWVAQCPAGYPVPKCMNGIFPGQVYSVFERAIDAS